MQGLQKTALLAVAAAWTAAAVANPHLDPEPVPAHQALPLMPAIVAERSRMHVDLEPDPRRGSPLHVIEAPGASFIKLHFSEFRLPAGIVVEISSPDGRERWRYGARQRDPLTFDAAMGDDGRSRFSAMSVTGDAVQIRLFGDLRRFDPGRHAIVIDSWLEGLPLEAGPENVGRSARSKDDATSQLQNSCGANQRFDAACWASSHEWEYERSAAVAKLITSQGEVCTAWRVGADNRLFTAEHCLGKQSELDGAEVWFNYQAVECGAAENSAPVKVAGGSLLASDQPLDYALFTVDNFPSVAQFPAFGLDVSGGELGKPIWIPQHGLGRPRQIALESDMNDSGVCEIDALNLDGYAAGSDIGYYCDTTTSSSGSPVVDYASGRAVALHHFGGCMNAGVSFARIWPEVSGFFGGEVPNGNRGDPGGGGDPTGENDAPEAGFDFSCEGLDCTFDGSASLDPDGQLAAYAWNFGDGNTGSGVSAAHGFADEGPHTVTLTVEDDQGATGSAVRTFTLTRPNEDPVAEFSSNCMGLDCSFDAGGSGDPDGDIVSWTWSLGDGTSASGETVEHAYAQGGSYTVTLTVHDDREAFDVRSRTMVLSKPNQPPTAEFTFSCDQLDCSFDAGASADADGAVTAWQWDFGDGTTASGQQAAHRYAAGGGYTVVLTVTDDDGAGDALSQALSVDVPNQPPSAAFTFSCDGLECSFDAGASADADGTLTAWQWDFGDGTTAFGPQASHRYAAGGGYTAVLTVTDDDGAGDALSQALSVDVPNQPPSAAFTFSCDGLECSFDAGASADADGTLTAWQWDFGDGTTASGPQATHSYAAAGDYTVGLTVVDDGGAHAVQAHAVRAESESGSEPSNARPVAEIDYACDALDCSLDASGSWDSDGDIVGYRWSFGDGSQGSGAQPVHHYVEPGEYRVTLIVEDDAGATGSHSVTIRVEQEQTPEISLSGHGSRHNGRATATLRWSGAPGATVELYRDGVLIAATPNDGKHIDLDIGSEAKSAVYQVCQASSEACSDTVSLVFGH